MTLDTVQVRDGRGPAMDAMMRRTRIGPTVLATKHVAWPAFVATARTFGVTAIVSFPMHADGEVVGALSIFARTEVSFPEPDLLFLAALADAGAIGLGQDLAARTWEQRARQLQHALDSRIVIEQAKGVIAASLGLSISDAYEILRRYARSRNLRVADVAADVTQRDLTARDLVQAGRGNGSDMADRS